MADENPTCSIVDGRSKTVFIAADIKDGEFTNRVRVWVGSADID